jgi:hypothetical protein
MCQEIHLSDVRLALLDFCEENEGVGERGQADDLIAQLDDAVDDPIVHVVDHRRRAKELALLGDESGAVIHRALSENIRRNAG